MSREHPWRICATCRFWNRRPWCVVSHSFCNNPFFDDEAPMSGAGSCEQWTTRRELVITHIDPAAGTVTAETPWSTEPPPLANLAEWLRK